MSSGRSVFLLAGLLATTALASALPMAEVPALAREDVITEARALSAMAGGDPGFAQTVAIAQAATRMQADLAGISPRVLPTTVHAGASDAVAALAARHQVAVPASVAARLAALEDPMGTALAGVVDAFIAFEAAGVEQDRASVLLARNDLLGAFLVLHDALAAGEVLPTLSLAPVLFVQGGDSCLDDTYTQDMVLLIDVCGNDVYRNNAGGAAFSTAALYDHAGDDLYDTPNTIGGATGGGRDGNGFLVDREGDDVYLGYDDGVNGGSYGTGAGFLLDAAGDDRYDTGEWGWGTNGGGYLGGSGMLVDRQGNDVYRGSFAAVNGGGAGGDGFLYDGAGNDVYEASFVGVNGGASSGTGRLIDVAGDDRYTATRIGVNGGARDGDGLLQDGGGRDVYIDQDGGSGIDVTVDPKGNAGRQLDE